MEQLLVLAVLISEGFDFENDYRDKLDEMFSDNPENELYIGL